jgi:hypothetical protein
MRLRAVPRNAFPPGELLVATVEAITTHPTPRVLGTNRTRHPASFLDVRPDGVAPQPDRQSQLRSAPPQASAPNHPSLSPQGLKIGLCPSPPGFASGRQGPNDSPWSVKPSERRSPLSIYLAARRSVRQGSNLRAPSRRCRTCTRAQIAPRQSDFPDWTCCSCLITQISGDRRDLWSDTGPGAPAVGGRRAAGAPRQRNRSDESQADGVSRHHPGSHGAGSP